MKIRNRERILMLLTASAIISSSVNMVFANEEYDDSIEEEYTLQEGYVIEDFSSEEEEEMQKARASVVIDAKSYGGLKGDGSNEATKLQAMFDKIRKEHASNKVTIKFPAGTYCTNKKITVYSNMTIEGVKDKTFFRNTARQPVFLNGKEGSSYKGNAGSNITVKNITFKNSRVMSVAHGKNITIDNISVIDGPNSHAIEIAASKNVVVKNSTFLGMNENDTTEFSRGRDFNEVIQIDRMAVSSFPHFGSYNDSNYQVSSKGVTIENCTFEPSKSHKYQVAIGTHGTHKNDVVMPIGLVIKGCTFKGATKAAINFPGVGDIKIENNTFSDMNNAIVYTSQLKKYETRKIVINKNKFNNIKNGIEIQMYKPSKNLGEISIKNNTFTHKKDGGTAINLKGTNKFKKISEGNNTITGYKKTIVKVKDSEEAPVIKSKDVVVKNNNVKVTSAPNKTGEVIGTLKKGTKITVYDTLSGMWKTTKVNGKSGYILTSDVEDITTNSTGNSSSNSSNSTSTASKATTGTITCNGVRIRKGAGINYGILTKLYKGNKVTIKEKNKNGWTKISYGEHTGYVSSDYIKVNTTTTSSSSKNTSSAKKTKTVTCDTLRVRKGPGTNYSIVTRVYKGNKLTIVEANKKGWTKISYGKHTGYVSSSYIK